MSLQDDLARAAQEYAQRLRDRGADTQAAGAAWLGQQFAALDDAQRLDTLDRPTQTETDFAHEFANFITQKGN
jgi:hypothetical protein